MLEAIINLEKQGRIKRRKRAGIIIPNTKRKPMGQLRAELWKAAHSNGSSFWRPCVAFFKWCGKVILGNINSFSDRWQTDSDASCDRASPDARFCLLACRLCSCSVSSVTSTGSEGRTWKTGG